MTQNWKEIWNKRKTTEALDLGELIKLDGFDTGAGKIEPKEWREYTDIIAKKLSLKNGQSVFEVGCGSGAFLYSLKEKLDLKVGGLDFSSSLVDFAKKAMPEGDFFAMDASQISSTPQYDFVVSNGVFHYFSSLDVAEKILETMISKAKTAVAVLEIPDAKTKEASENMRRDKLTHAEYEAKYKGLEHIYFSRDWFKNIADKHGFKFESFDGCVPGYVQNNFRFGFIMWKN
jgi:trans-aconitate methyltransferase